MESRIETHPVGKKSACGSVFTGFADGRKKGRAWGLALLMCHSPQPPHHPHLQICRLVCFPIFGINGAALLPKGLCLIWFRVTIFSLRSCPPLFCNFQLFNVKAAAAHHPIIQKEVDELLAKGAIELSSGDACFYSSVFLVPRHTGGLQPILNLKQFNFYLHIASF